jgi:hypothetical protein
MTTYKVLAQYTTYVYTHIEAENYEQAQELANNLDGSDFKETGQGDWDIYSVEKIKETA